MKIEAGQWWEDGRGRRVKIVHVAPEIHDYCVIGIIRGDNLFCCEEWTAAGWYSSANQHPRHNLVKHLPECTGWDWEPPKPVDPGEGWRLLKVGEIIQRNDELHEGGGGWRRVFDCFVGENLASSRTVIRRRVKPDPGEGWKLIPAGQLINEGDEWWNEDHWELVKKQHANIPVWLDTLKVRRRIQPDVPADWRLIGGVPGGMLYFKPTEAT